MHLAAKASLNSRSQTGIESFHHQSGGQCAHEDVRIHGGRMAWELLSRNPQAQDDLSYYYAAHFDTVEIDSTWHRATRERTVQNWAAQTPDNFVFPPKWAD
jgi:hypothetical protein